MGVGPTAAPPGPLGALWGSGVALMVLATLFWAGNFVVGRAVHAEVTPVALAFWRWTVAFLVVAGPAARHLRRDGPALVRAWATLPLLAWLGVAVFNTLVYVGLARTGAINGVLIQSTMPLLILVATFLLFRERVGPAHLAAVGVSLAGVAVIAARGSVEALLGLRVGAGDAWILGAACTYALYAALLRRRPAVHPLSFVAATFGLGALMLAPAYLHQQLSGPAFVARPDVLLAIAYVALFPSVASYLFFNRAVELIGANRAGQFAHLIPVFGTALAVVFLGEGIAPYHVAGAALIGLGIALATRRARPASAAPA